MNKQDIISSRSYLSIRKYYIINLGCAKNQVDAETIITALENTEWQYTKNPEEAELFIINSCGFIKPAKEETISTVFSLRQEYPDKKIILAGCLAQRYGSSLRNKLKEIDGIFGNRAPERITEIIPEVMKGGNPVFLPENSACVQQLRTVFLSGKGTVYVKISEGCNNRCSYCAIPLIRGNLKSRQRQDIVKEIDSFIKSGVFEINLIGQDIASFGLDRGKSELPELLTDISSLKGDFWLRMLYIHPDRFPDEIIDICLKDKRILPYFDLPFQHASEKILERMGRNGSADKYLGIIESIRSELPDAVIRSTFITGFPGEREKEFQELVSFQRAAKLDWAGFFPYFREEGTPAFKYRGKILTWISGRKTLKRKAVLEKVQTEITEKQMERFVGRKLDIFIEEKVKEESIYFGRAFLHAPEVDGLVVVHADNLDEGKIVCCNIIKRNNFDLEAVPL